VRQAGNRGLSVLVREKSRETDADIWIRPPAELKGFLERWLKALSGERARAWPSRMLRSTVTALRPLRMREIVARATPICSANSVAVIVPRNSFSSSPGLAGLCIMAIVIAPLVVIQVINEDCVFLLKGKGQAPIAVHANRPVSFEVSLERMPIPTISFERIQRQDAHRACFG
jgi:hypothetical protein